MNTDELTKRLVEAGMVTEEEVMEIHATTEAKSVTEVMHTLFCRGHYGRGPECKWYDEIPLTDCWKKPDHLRWMKQMLTLTNTLGISVEALDIVLAEVRKTIAEKGEAYLYMISLAMFPQLFEEFMESRKPSETPDDHEDELDALLEQSDAQEPSA